MLSKRSHNSYNLDFIITFFHLDFLVLAVAVISLPVSSWAQAWHCNRAYTRGDRQGNQSEQRSSRRQSPVGCSIKQIKRSPEVYTWGDSRGDRLVWSSWQSPHVYTTGNTRSDNCSDSRSDDRPEYTPYKTVMQELQQLCIHGCIRGTNVTYLVNIMSRNDGI